LTPCLPPRAAMKPVRAVPLPVMHVPERAAHFAGTCCWN
jgi:hypothetical protein